MFAPRCVSSRKSPKPAISSGLVARKRSSRAGWSGASALLAQASRVARKRSSRKSPSAAISSGRVACSPSRKAVKAPLSSGLAGRAQVPCSPKHPGSVSFADLLAQASRMCTRRYCEPSRKVVNAPLSSKRELGSCSRLGRVLGRVHGSSSQ
jgi:hypothetical protein